MNDENQVPRKHKRYDETFKRNAVELWLSGGQIGPADRRRAGRQRPEPQAVETEAGGAAGHRARAAFGATTRRGSPPAQTRTAPRRAPAGHSKKNLGHPLRTQRERLERIKAMNRDDTISELCEALAVSRSGYHARAGRAPGPRAQGDALLPPLITQAHRESRQTYGSPRITRWLRERGQRCGHVRVARLMRQAGLSHRWRRRFRPMSLTDSDHDQPVAPNLLAHRLPTPKPEAVWVADLTYVPTLAGWLYVAGILDRCTRRCIGWAFDDTLATTLPLAALDMALTQRKPPAGLVHHSDRGVPYASAAYRQRLAHAGVIPSMSRRGNCHDNAMMESFWSTLKRELVHRCLFATRAQARLAIFEWIETVYNRTRFHSALGFKSPVDFEIQLN